MGTGCCDGVGPSTGPRVWRRTAGIFPAGKAGVTVPQVIFNPEPSFSEEARKAKAQGMVMLLVVVGKDGHPYDIRVGQSLGMGLDEKAIEAVTRWRFRPATLNGRARRHADRGRSGFPLVLKGQTSDFGPQPQGLRSEVQGLKSDAVLAAVDGAAQGLDFVAEVVGDLGAAIGYIAHAVADAAHSILGIVGPIFEAVFGIVIAAFQIAAQLLAGFWREQETGQRSGS